MTQREIVLWVDERWCKALEKLDGKELTCAPAEPEETCGSRRLRKEDIDWPF